MVVNLQVYHITQTMLYVWRITY